MPHPDPERLDALVYGMLEEPAAGEIRTHLAACARCRSTVVDIGEEAANLRTALRAAPPRRIPLLAVAAAASVLLAALSFLLRETPGPLRLPDGTVVHARGTVRVEGPRKLYVGSGDYYLAVATAPEPFLVRTPTAEIVVRGTRFYVRVKEEKMSRRDVLVTLVAVTAGAVAVGNWFGWVDLGPAEEAVVPEMAGPRVTTGPDLRATALRTEFADLLREKREIERQLEDRGPVRRPVALPPDKAAGSENATPQPEEIPPAVRDAAANLGVSEAALAVAFDLDAFFRREPHARDPELLPKLEAFGEDGYRAVLALLRGGRSGIWIKRMLGATWAPGLESLLIDLAEDPEVHEFSKWSALSALGLADTPKSRDYLVARLEGEQDAGLYMSAAGALGELGESRGARHLDDRITRAAWCGVRGPILQAAGKMGGAEAARFLTDYARQRGADNLDTALASLARIDADAAAAEARALMAGTRFRLLDQRTRREIERIAGEKR